MGTPRSPAPRPVLPPHASNRLYTIYMGAGGGFAALSLMVLGVSPSGVAAVLLGGAFAGIGLWGRSSAAGAQALNLANDLVMRGRLTEADRLLDGAEQHLRLGHNRRVLHSRRATIALRRGDLGDALRHASAAVDERTPWYAVLHARILRIHARGLRALLRASLGDAEGARADAAAVQASPHATPSALARAALAEALLLERAGERAALREHLQVNRVLFGNAAELRERAIVRAYQRMLKVSSTSVYRKAAPREEERAGGEEPELQAWMAKIAPGAAAFTPRPPDRGDAPLPPDEPVAEEARRAVARARKQNATPGTAARRRGRLALAAAVAIVMLCILALLQLAPRELAEDDVPGSFSALLDGLLAVLPIALAGSLVALFVTRMVRSRRHLRALQQAMARLARGQDEALADLRRLAERAGVFVAAQARLELAHAAERAGELAEALGHADKGLALLGAYAARVVAADALHPGLVAERAFVLAALGREAEATAELASLPPAYPFLARDRFRVRLAQRAHRGGLAGAAELVDHEARDLPVFARDELLADAVRVAVRPEACGAGEVARVKEELRTNAPMRRWMETVAPAVLAAAETSPEAEEEGPGRRFATAAEQAPPDADADAEAEAAAHDEAVATGGARLAERA